VLFGVLGPIEAYDSHGARIGLGAGKPATLLAALLLHANEWVDVDRLIDAIWHEQDTPPSADQNLKTYIWRLRRLLADANRVNRVDSRPGAYRIRIESGDLDVHLVERYEAAAEQALANGDTDTAIARLTAALQLWRGRPYAELPDSWTSQADAHSDRLRWRVREKLAEAHTCQGSPEAAASVLWDLVGENPLAEGAWTRLVLTLHAAGRRAEALVAFQQARSVLVEELGVEPGTELAGAQRAVLRASAPRRDLPRTVPDFTGRTAELTRMKTLLRGNENAVGVLVVHGMPGVGKTALAIHAAHELAAEHPGGQLFVELHAHDQRGPLDPADVLARLLRAAGVPVPSDVDERAALWRSSIADRRLLLVLDDALDAAQVRPLLPGSPGCAVLITTRNRLSGLDGVETLGLGPLPDAAAARLFRSTVSPEAVRRCGGLPAAVRAASARLHYRPQWTLDWLADELIPLFEPSLQGLSPVARDLLLTLGTRSVDPIDVRTAASLSGLDFAAAQRNLELLCDRHLLMQLSPGRFACHVTVRDQARRLSALQPAQVA
jgi:DNA-binding SARP family transcriptional activator